MDKLDGLSMNLEQANLEKLATVFPEVMVEGRLDLEKLLDLLGQYDIKDFEKYKFEWKGKSECLQLAQRRSTAMLRPKPNESVNFDATNNVYIKGDNLEVLKLLQTAYFRKVKMIYIDPPYNTGNDFVYEDDFADPLARYKEVTEQTTKSNPETMGRFHTNWLNMMYPRLRLAANLLRDDGVIFISIDDHEVHNLRKLCDECFGEENFIGDFIWKSRQIVDSRNKTGFSNDHEFILVYCKRIEESALVGKPIDVSKYSNPDDDPRGAWMSNTMLGLANASQRPNLHYSITDPKTGIEYPCNPDTGWRFSKETMAQKIAEGRILFPKDPNGRPREKKFLDELEKNMTGISSVLPESVGYTLNGTKEVRNIFDDKYFDFPKPVELIKFFLMQGTASNENDIILDFFSGSATTAHAVMQLNAEDGGNRQFVMVQLPEMTDEKSEAYKAGYKNICEIGMERIRRAGAKLTETDGQIKLGDDNKQPLDIGFKVFELDSSNMHLWDATPVSKEQQEILFDRMNDMIENVKPDRTELEVAYEIMLKMGLPLTYPILTIDINGKKVWNIGEECMLLICLARNITPDDVTKMCGYTPAKIVMADFCFEDTTAMANANYIMQRYGVPLKLL